MQTLEVKKKRGAVNIICALAALLYFLFSLGFWFHTVSHPTILGRYSFLYLLAVCLLTLLTPYAFFTTRFLLSERNINPVSGGSFTLKPRVKLAWIALGLVLAFGVLEWVLALKEPPKEKIESFHPYLQVQSIPGDRKENVNQWGFRGEEIEKKKHANIYRIFVLGGSTVRCEETEFEKTHPRIMERELREHYPGIRIEVQNAGMDWHTSEHSLIKFLTKIQDFDPDLIIIYHGINDLYRSFSPREFAYGPYKDDYSHYYGPLKGMIDAYYLKKDSIQLRSLSFLSRALQDLWFSDFQRERGETFARIPVKEWKSLPAFERNMSNFASIVKSKNISLIMASQPFLYRKDLTEREKKTIWIDRTFMAEDRKIPDFESLVNGMNAFNETSRKIANNYGIPFIDLEKLVPKTLDYLYDDVHYTEKGNRLIGEALAQFIVEQRIIERKFPR